MVLMQIAEPGAAVQEPAQRKIGVGIDLGTTNSLVAHFDGEDLVVFTDEEGRKTLPSVVHYSENGIVVGHSALEKPASDFADTVASAKRLMGKSRSDITDDGHLTLASAGLAFRTSQGDKTPVEVSAEILSVLKDRAAAALSENPDGVVITVPAYFDDAQRQATRQAADLIGLNVLRLLNEPTAAAVAYGLDSGDEGVIAVYDLGGGTFDISILRMEKGVFEVLATGGDSALGGDDFDAALADHFLEHLGLIEPTVMQRRQLLKLGRRAKEALTQAETFLVDLSDLDLPEATNPSSLTIDRSTLNGLCAPLINRTLEVCSRCVEDAGVSAVDQVVLVGGSTRMPVISKIVGELFGKAPLSDIDPDLVVAMGAARQADILVGNRSDSDVLLLDVIPLSLGIETYGGLVERLVPRNTTIPVTRAQEFTTARDGQTGLDVHVVQGEREQVVDCRSLARFQLSGIPPMVAGAARIRVMFKVDADGLLEVSAQEEITGAVASVVVKPSFGLADEQVTEMLQSSYTHAAEDMVARQLTEARVEAEQLIAGVHAAIAVDGDLLSPDERAALEGAVEHLQGMAEQSSLEAVRDAIDVAGKATEAFAARRMDRSIQQALSGVSLADLDEEVES